MNGTEEVMDAIKRIAHHYGYEKQSWQMVEEMAELTQAITKFWRKQMRCGEIIFMNVESGSEEEEHIKEELADVTIMLLQMFVLLNVGDDGIETLIYKINRQLERIKMEDKNEL